MAIAIATIMLQSIATENSACCPRTPSLPAVTLLMTVDGLTVDGLAWLERQDMSRQA